jgi:dsDNA-specific endonuclease/ATPase MutS2
VGHGETQAKTVVTPVQSVYTFPDELDIGRTCMEEDPVEVPIEDTMDLHSFLPGDVPSVVLEYLEQASKKGFREVRLIHGRGIGVQRAIVHSILRKHEGVVSFKDAEDLGSTTVRLGPN